MTSQRVAARLIESLLLISTASICVPPVRAVPVLQVNLYNYAGLQSQTLAYSEYEAQRLLHRGGVDVVWHDCRNLRTCELPISPDVVVLRLVAGAGTGFSEKVIGFALPVAGGGKMATVFCDRAISLRQSGVFLHQILGKVIAHEIAHLLLGENSHNAAGVMRPLWTQHSMGSESDGQWFFTARQTAAIREEAVRRSMGVRKESRPLTQIQPCPTLQNNP